MINNFFLLLELEPEEKDVQIIKNQISKKQTDWSKQSNHPTKGQEYKRNLDLLPQIQEVMLNPQKRAKEANEARRLKREAEKEAFQLVDKSIEVLSINGEIQEQEFEELCRRFSNIAPEDIRRRITVPIVKGKAKHQREGLDQSLKQTIDDTLKILGQQSLYEFLVLSPSSSLATLQNRTQERYKELSCQANKDTKVTAALELTGHCRSIFKNDLQRELYDRSLAQAHYETLNEALDIAGMDGNISAKEYAYLLKKAQEFGIQHQDAEEYILDYVKQKKWSLERSGNTQAENMRRCAACGVTTLATAKNCSNCGHELQVACPQCRQKNFSDTSHCSGCGFNIGDMPNALPLIESARQALQRGDKASARHLFEQAAKYWPHHPDIENPLSVLRNEYQTLANYPQLLKQALSQKHYYKAEQLLNEIERVAPSHPELMLRSQTDQAIKGCKEWLLKARDAIHADDQSYAYEKALAISADCPVALMELSRLTQNPRRLNLSVPVKPQTEKSVQKKKNQGQPKPERSLWSLLGVKDKAKNVALSEPEPETKAPESLLSDVLIIGPVASGKTTLTASLQFAAMQGQGTAYQIIPKNPAMIQLFQSFGETIYSGQIPINATMGEITEYQFQLMLNGQQTPFHLLDGPGGAIFDAQHHFREEMLWNLRRSEGLLFCLDITDQNNIRQLFTTLPSLFPQVLNYKADQRLKLKRIAIVLTKVDRYISDQMKSGQLTAQEALDFAKNLDPAQLVREVVMDINLRPLFQYTNPDTVLACGISSIFGFRPDTGEINFNPENGGLSSYFPGASPQQVLANWHPFRVLEPFAFLATGELGHMAVLKSL